MNENETLEVTLESEWEGEGASPEIPEETQEVSDPEEAKEDAIREEAPAPPPLPPIGQKADAILARMRHSARQQDMERFLRAYPQVDAGSIPKEVWGQVARGVPLVSAYALHENQQLRAQLAAERQDRLNRQRTPGSLGGNVGAELDELDRMWTEDD